MICLYPYYNESTPYVKYQIATENIQIVTLMRFEMNSHYDIIDHVWSYRKYVG